MHIGELTRASASHARADVPGLLQLVVLVARHGVHSMPAGKSRNTGSGSSRHKVQKRSARTKFESRHIDQVFEDYVQQEVAVVCDGKHGPLGTTTRYGSNS